MATNKQLGGDAYVTKEGVYLYPNKEVDIKSLTSFILDNEYRSTNYRKNYDLYTGQHEILNEPHDPKSARPDNRLVSNWANYVVDTYVGYFMGKPPKISFDDDSRNDQLQDWLELNSFKDKLAEIAKQVAIYGRSYMLAYQTEDANSEIAVVDPASGFMIYDTSINPKPIAFVRYGYLGNELHGEMYTANKIQTFTENQFNEETATLFNEVPAVEFISSGQRLSIVGKIASLVNEYDRAFSQKANQVAYFDEAYLKILGVPLKLDEKTGEPILDIDKNKVIYSPSPDAVNGDVDFISKPDGDNMQENMLTRLKDDIFQTAMVTNLNDEAFSGNSSGVAIKYKLLSMQNQAAFEERKFRISLRQLLGVVLSMGKVVGSISADDVRQNIQFKFNRNIPADIANQAQIGKDLQGITSDETVFANMPDVVDDPQKEAERIADEQADKIKQAVKNTASATDIAKGGNNGEDTQEPSERGILASSGRGGTNLDKAKPS